MIQAGPRHLRPTYDEDEPPPYARITPEPMSPTVGAEIQGVSLAEPLDERRSRSSIARCSSSRSSSFVIRTSHRSSTSPSRAASATLETHPFVPHREGHPEVMVLKKNDRIGGYENVWHSDVTWRLAPSLGSVLLAREVPRSAAIRSSATCTRRTKDWTTPSVRRSTACVRCTISPGRSAAA